MRALVVVPARDEAARIAACLRALAGQEGVERPGVVLVLDGCADATEAVARATAAACDLSLELVEGPGHGVGFARRAGFAAARVRAPAVIASTDADSVVAPDWLARTLARVEAGAAAVGGRIVLDPEEAAALPPAVLGAREAEAERRLAAVRRRTPGAEHHQFSGASLALTRDAHDAVGGIPAVPALEDEALERALLAAGLPIAYAADVRVTTSARTESRVPRGLAQVLRTASWRATRGADGRGTARTTAEAGLPPGVAVLADGARGDALHAARAGNAEVVLALGPGVDAAAAAPLVDLLLADPGLQLVRAAEPHPDPLAELVARPALNLHAPELAVLASPLTRTWAIRRAALGPLALPHGDAADLTVLLDVWRAHGLAAIGEHAVAAPGPPERADAPLAAYELLAALAVRVPHPPTLSSAYADPAGTRRATLDEHPPPDRAAGSAHVTE